MLGPYPSNIPAPSEIVIYACMNGLNTCSFRTIYTGFELYNRVWERRPFIKCHPTELCCIKWNNKPRRNSVKLEKKSFQNQFHGGGGGVWFCIVVYQVSTSNYGWNWSKSLLWL